MWIAIRDNEYVDLDCCNGDFPFHGPGFLRAHKSHCFKHCVICFDIPGH